MLMFGCVDWVVVNWDCDNMWFNDDWVWNLDWNMDWEWNLDFLYNWNFNFLVDWNFLDMMMMDGVNVVWDIDLDVVAD